MAKNLLIPKISQQVRPFKGFLQTYSHLLIPLSIFCVSLWVYLSNNATISSGDVVPATLIGFNILENHTFHLDPLRGGYIYDIYRATVENPPYFFNETQSGHLASGYPIGPVLVTFPLYCLFYLYLKLAQIPVDLNAADFEVHRVFFEKLAVSIIAALAAVFFYLATRLKFSRSVALVSTFTFAFATNQWMISSQGMWQHGISNFVLIVALYCLLKANYAINKNRWIYLLGGGIACGLFPSIRPSSSAFALSATLYVLFVYRKKSIPFILGLGSSLIGFAWNWYYYQSLIGGYGNVLSHYNVTVSQFVGAFLGLTISPSRGIFIITPIALLSLVGAYRVFQARRGNDEKLVGLLFLASLLIFFNYCFWIWWTGLNCWGARFLTDVLPILCYLLNYVFVDIFPDGIFSRRNFSLQFWVIIALIGISTFAQFVGAYGYTSVGGQWKVYPFDSDTFDHRNWDPKDSMVGRHARYFWMRNFVKPDIDSKEYLQHFQGEIETIQIIDTEPLNYVHNLLNLSNLRGEVTQDNHHDNQPLTLPFEVKPVQHVMLRAELINTGDSPWYGYEMGLNRGTTRVKVQCFDQNNILVSEGELSVYGKIKKGEKAAAVGAVTFHQAAEIHQIKTDLIVSDVGEFPLVGVSRYAPIKN